MPRKIHKKTKKKKKTKFLSLRHLNLNHTPAADEDSVAEDFFNAAVEDSCGATLAALFGAVSPSDTAHESLSLSCVGQDPTQDSGTLSPSLTCAPRDPFRGAMKGREEREDEKWVCYDEVTSCDAGVKVVKVLPHQHGLSLKLDYQEIIDAWCDKGSLYMPGPQTVPDLSDDFLNFRGCDGFNDGWRSHGSLWTVPENTVGKEGVKVEQDLEEELKLRHREASVLRYKEKRRNRLFSKRIRYEVRKINAEKRPRMKGRFVKRN